MVIRKIYKSQIDNISANKFKSIRIKSDDGGTVKLSKSEVKDMLAKDAAGGKLAVTIEKKLKERGVKLSQGAKRRELMKLIKGENEKKLTKSEERLLDKRRKAMVRAGLASAERAGSGMASNLLGKRSKEGAVRRSTTTGDRKITAEDLGVKGPEYDVTMQGSKVGSVRKNPTATASQQGSGAASVAGGVGAKGSSASIDSIKKAPSSGGLNGLTGGRGSKPLGFN